MNRFILYTSHSPAQLRPLIALLPQVLGGGTGDKWKLAEGFRLRIAAAFLSLVEQDFILKSRGGTGDSGDTWPKLTQAYLAYGRPGTICLKRVNGRRVGTKVSGLAPGNKDGYMTKDQLKDWRRVYGHTFARLAASMPIEEAKSRAAAAAWNAAKRDGVQTKWNELGTREVEILRDTGTLFNSLSPGIITDQGTTASYAPPANQFVKTTLNTLVVGTNVPYAEFHQNAKSPRRLRRIFPVTLPADWMEGITEAVETGLTRAVELLARRMAA